MTTEHALLRTILYLHSRLERSLRGGDLPLGLSQYRLLFLVQEGPARSVELAAASGLTKPSVSAQLAQLERSGWIARQALPDDRRAASIRITRAGQQVLARFEADLNRVLAEFLGAAELARADEDVQWLVELWAARRAEAHDRWALRRVPGSTS